MALLEGRYTSPGITDHSKIYPTGGYPEGHVVALAPTLFDPRVTGASYADRNSWVWSDNGVLNVLSHLLDPREEGGEGWPIEALHLDDIAEEAWKADVIANGEPRSRCWGVRSLGPDVDSKSVLAAMLLSTGTTILPTQDGRFTIRLVDDNPVPTGTLEWRFVVGDERTAGPQAVDRANKLVLKYYSPERAYEVAEADLTNVSWAKDQDEIDRWGERVYTLDLPWCPSPIQAGKIGRRLFALKRAAGGTRRTTIAGMALMGHENVAMVDDEFGLTINATLTGVRLDSIGAEGPISITYLETPVLAEWNNATDAPGAPVERGIVPDGNRVGAPTIRRVKFVKTNYGGNPKWAIRVNIDVGGSFDGINVIRRTPTGRTFTEWTVFPLTGVSGNAGLSVPGTGSPGWYAVQTEDGLATDVIYDISSEQVKSTVNISDWCDITRYSYDLTPTAPATPTVAVLSTDGVTSAIEITSSWDTSYFIIRNSSGTSIINGGDSKINGTYQVTGLTVGTTYKITAYSALDVPSADLSYLVP
ncbi:phage tail protein [Prosthecomicrobium hirschii]|uniref:phage tail protein n=1 Tax=Prosthecodimorpha hirschii TaxID=665126 RepID=UPI00221F1878|nr:phage tail protein [Prosthecomicrobium hirschii]MCW1844116.1 phage tail protein [Prosthecomicrobium hirschii]